MHDVECIRSGIKYYEVQLMRSGMNMDELECRITGIKMLILPNEMVRMRIAHDTAADRITTGLLIQPEDTLS